MSIRTKLKNCHGCSPEIMAILIIFASSPGTAAQFSHSPSNNGTAPAGLPAIKLGQNEKIINAAFIEIPGSLDVKRDLSDVDVIMSHAKIGGDLIFRHLPKSIDLSDAVVSGSVWIGDWPDQKDFKVFPKEDKNLNKYPDAESEGCWRLPPTYTAPSRIILDRLRARNLFLRYISIDSLRALHATIDDSIYLDHSSFTGRVNFGFVRTTNMEFVGAYFGKGIDLQSVLASGNIDAACTLIGGSIDGLAIRAVGYTQFVGSSVIPGSDPPSIDFTLGSFGGLLLAGMSGHFSTFSLANAKIEILALDYENPPDNPSLQRPWTFSRVITNGATFNSIRPAQRTRPVSGDRVGAFADAAKVGDDRIYRKLAEAYARDGNVAAANNAWARYSLLTGLIHLPLTSAIGLLLSTMSVECVANVNRMAKFYHRNRIESLRSPFYLLLT